MDNSTAAAGIAPLRLGGEDGWSYAPAPESTDHVELRDSYGLFIDGQFTDAADGRTFETANPATEEKIADVALASDVDVDVAMAAARRAYEDVWSVLAPRERGKYVYRIARVLQERCRELAITESLDGGKPIRESRDVDIPLAAAHFFYYAGWADKLDYAFPGRGAEPLGVAGQVIPWNFPLLMAAWKIAPAIAAGNTVVLKPAETTPLTALKLAEIIQEAGLPPGVVNIVTGAGETGAAVVQHECVDKVAFTGSTEVGKLIRRALAGAGKHYTLELGGKAANLVFEDAAVDQAVEGIVNGIFFNQGHVCCAGSRLLVQESVADQVISRLKARMETLIVGDPLDKNTDIGAINSRAQLDRIEEYLEIGEAEGAEPFQTSCRLPERGYWCRPTLFLRASQSHRVVQEEIFGPVLAVQTFRTVDEGIAMANNTPYGLSGGVWSDKGAKAFRVTSRIRAGVLWANTYNRFDPTAPFGGYKESGIGREGGISGLHAYLRPLRRPFTARSIDPESGGAAGGDRMSRQRSAASADRLPVLKTYKIYVGGRFPRSESGRFDRALALDGTPIANICRCSRKDVRDAVTAARAAQAGWAARTACNRGQILYRIAEMLEGRSAQFEALLAAGGAAVEDASAEVQAAIERLVHYAGWTDKYNQVLSSVNPVATSHFNFSILEPMGVVGVLAPESPLLGLVSAIAPAIAGGNTTVVLVTGSQPLPAVTFGEVLNSSDVPGGVVNLLTGRSDEMLAPLAAHRDVDALLLCTGDRDVARAAEIEAVHNLKRVAVRPHQDWTAVQGLFEIADLQEVKTTWHPIGN